MGERTGFEWLDTPFIITRTLATLLGAWFVVLLLGAGVEAVEFALSARRRSSGVDAGPQGEAEFHPVTCGVERHPIGALGAAAFLSVLPIAGMIFVWRRPRLGFLLAAGAWIVWVVIFVDPHPEEAFVDWRFWSFLLVPPAWLGFAATKIGPSPRAARIYSSSR